MQGGARSKLLKITQNCYLCLIKQVLDHFRARGARGCKVKNTQNYYLCILKQVLDHFRARGARGCKGVQDQNYSKLHFLYFKTSFRLF